MDNKLGCDVSLWQDNNSTPQMMNFNKAKAEGLEFAFIKVSQSVWADQDYTMNWNNAKLAGIPRGGYHYLDWTKPAIEQARFFCGMLKNDIGELEPVLDFECRKNTPDNAEHEAKIFVLETERLLGRRPIIYTSPYFWDTYGSSDPFWTRYKLWIANYGVTSPRVPSPWDTWYLWQFTDRGDGIKYGAESLSLDLNWFNCDKYDWPFDDVIVVPPPSDTYKVKTTAYLLNIRTNPYVSNETKIGSVPYGTVFEAYEQQGDWLKVFAYLHKDYVKRI